MKKHTEAKSKRDDEWRKNQQEDPATQQKRIAAEIKAARNKSSFFGRNCKWPIGKYRLLTILTVAIAAYVYYISQRNNGSSKNLIVNEGRGFNPNYLNSTELKQVLSSLESNNVNSVGMLTLMHQFASKLVSPGEILFPVKARGGIQVTPFPFCKLPDGRVRGKQDTELYQEASNWFKARRNILEMTPKMFVANLKILNRKVTGAQHDTHNFRSSVVWLRRGTAGLFDADDHSAELLNILGTENLKIVASIRGKVNYIAKNVAKLGQEADEYHYRESLMTDLYMGEKGDLQKMAVNANNAKSLEKIRASHLTKKEKQVVRQLYDVKEQLTPAEHAERIEQDFAEFLSQNSSQDDIVTRAGKLQFLILKRHGFGEGNGRSARIVADIFLEQQGMPPIFYPDRVEYHLTVAKAVTAEDPQILIDYLRPLINGRKYVETMKLAADIQRECVDVPGGSEHCDEILLGTIARSRTGFC